MKILGILAFKTNNQSPQKQKKVSFGNAIDTGAKFAIDHADVLVTHRCNKGCPTCIDKWVNKYKQIISFDIIKKYFNLLERNTVSVPSPVNKEGRTLINILGGEPTVVGEEFLNQIAENAHERNFLMWTSTNGIKTETVKRILPNFDMVHITVDKPEDAIKWADSEYLNRIDIKYPCTEKTSLEDFLRFVNITKDFPNKKMIVYNDLHRKEIKMQPELAALLDGSDVKYTVAPHGFQKYADVYGVTIKRTIQEDNHFADSQMIPRLYPNGNYNCTWENELNNPYLGEL